MTNTEPKKKVSVTSGYYAIGACVQWFIDTQGANNQSFNIFSTILRNTFGYRKRYGYIKQSIFGVNPHTLKKYRDWLKSKGIIDWKETKGLTMYKILEPKEIIDKFTFVGSKTSSENEQYVSSDEDLLVDGREW